MLNRVGSCGAEILRMNFKEAPTPTIRFNTYNAFVILGNGAPR
jgi:hypothetical protein